MFEALAGTSATALDELAPLVGDMWRGDRQALESLFEATVGKLYALASAILRHNESAEEVVCETYAQAWDPWTGWSRWPSCATSPTRRSPKPPACPWAR